MYHLSPPSANRSPPRAARSAALRTDASGADAARSAADPLLACLGTERHTGTGAREGAHAGGSRGARYGTVQVETGGRFVVQSVVCAGIAVDRGLICDALGS